MPNLYIRPLAVLTLALFVLQAGLANDLDDGDRELTDLSFEELLDLEVTSVGKKAQKLSSAAAAIYVITREELLRSGATTIPEALRMVPGIAVAQLDSNKWSVSSRGFSGRFANKLLVLIDGRSVYTPSFSGVYWEMHDLVLEDVDRIEVIRGPGATLWGANAVNGVINITTRSAHETQEGLLAAAAGNNEHDYTVRQGGSLGRHTAYRAFAKYVDRDEFETSFGDDGGDHWNIGHVGFRVDSDRPSGDQITFQGDFIDGDFHQNLRLLTTQAPNFVFVDDEVSAESWNLLGRWQKPLSVNSDLTVQAYFDHSERDEAFLGQQNRTADVELQHRFGAGKRHDVVWGIGYRHVEDEFRSTQQVMLEPTERSTSLWNAFVQDDITVLKDQLQLTLGIKVENNDFTGTEVQPSVRFLWTPGTRHTFWGAVSEAVRIPSRAEVDSRIWTEVAAPGSSLNPTPFPALLFAIGNPNLEAEELTAYELGYRVAVTNGFNLDLTVYHNDYERLRTAELGELSLVDFSYVDVPLEFSNGGTADTTGFEMLAEWRPRADWRLQLAYTKLDLQFESDPSDLENGGIETASPENQLSLRSSLDLSPQVQLDLWARHVDSVSPPVSNRSTLPEAPDYWDLDFQLTWQPASNWSLSLVGQNLLDGERLEGFQESFVANPIQVQRGYYAAMSWKF